MPEIKYADNPNEETAFVTQDDGTRSRAVLTAAVEGDIEFPDNPNSTKVMVTVDGVKHRAVAVANVAGGGGSGGDQHNLGYYATQAALEEAHPTAEAGDWAIVGATDTVWIWDTDNSEWVDSDQKGQVTSVNGQTGAVVLTIPDAVQYSTMPTASADNLGKIVQFTGTTDANYTNGYFYKCVSDGQDPATYSWEAVEVQAGGGLPDQTGNSGKFLTTDGTDASWSDKPLVNGATASSSIKIGTTSGASDSAAVLVGKNTSSTAFASSYVGVGSSAKVYGLGVAIGSSAEATGAQKAIAIGYSAKAISTGAIQLGAGQTNSDANTLKVANANGNFEIMSADGTIPEARLADTTNAAQGQVLTLDSNLNAVWQAGGGGGSSYTAGTGIDITNDTISVTSPVLTNKANFPDSSIQINPTATSGMNGSNAIAIGIGSRIGIGGVAIGNNISTNAGYLSTTVGNNISNVPGYGSVNLGNSVTSTAGTLSVALSNQNPDYTVSTDTYILLNRDGTVPADRIAPTTGLADGNYRLRLVMASGVPTLEWVAE